jgi:hypothetical protein
MIMIKVYLGELTLSIQSILAYVALFSASQI